MDFEKYGFMEKIDLDSEEDEFVKEIRVELKAKDKKIEELEAKLKQNEFEIIASGEVNCYRHEPEGDIVKVGNVDLWDYFYLKDKYKGKNIQIGVRVVK